MKNNLYYYIFQRLQLKNKQTRYGNGCYFVHSGFLLGGQEPYQFNMLCSLFVCVKSYLVNTI